ncbi:MAG: right-handed parallel beta-helix repeat-containing protein [Acidobacteriota bacterium]
MNPSRQIRSAWFGPAIPLLFFLAGPQLSIAARYPCTEAGFEQAIQDACPAGNTTITFECAPGSVVRLSKGHGPQREIPAGCDHVIIDGENNVTFEAAVPWWDDGLHCVAPDFNQSCDPDGDGVPDFCPEFEGGERFVMIRGNNDTIQNLSFRNFFEGIGFNNGTSGNTIDNITCDKPGDDCFTNEWDTSGNAARNLKLSNACDKAVSLYGRDVSKSSGFDLVLENSTFTNVISSFSLPGGASAGGRFLIRNNTFQNVNSTSLWHCDNVSVRSTSVTTFENNLIDGCQRGLRAKQQSQLIAKNNVIINCPVRGAWLFDSSRGFFENNVFRNNGGASSSNAFYGGIAVSGSAQADLGGGSLLFDGQTLASQGGNLFQGNRSPSDPTLDLENKTGATVKAEGNCWGDADPSDQVEGLVDYQPLGASCGGADTVPPGTPANLRRRDIKQPPI